MRGVPLTLVLCLVTSLAQAQVTLVAPGAPVKSGRQSEANYGPPRVIELDALLLMPESYQSAHVIVEGEVRASGAGGQWVLSGGGSDILIIPGHQFDPSQFSRTSGKRVELRGIVRTIRPKEYLGHPPVDRDLLDDPILPPLPPPSPELPRGSITIFAMRDRSNFETFEHQEEIEAGISGRILEEPAAYLGKTTKILGQFRGRNLFGDLPANSARGKDDWVLREGDGAAIWVTGKAPKGDGWKLDLNYKGDSKTWLEVEGKAEVVSGVVYLKAARIIPSKPPGTERRSPPSH